MKVLFIMKEPSEVRPFASVLRLLDQRGHRLHLAFKSIKTSESHAALRKLAGEYPRITLGEAPPPGKSHWMRLARPLRRGIDYLHYLEPRYEEAAKLRARVEHRTPSMMRTMGRLAALAGPHGVATLRRTLQLVERCLLPSPEIERFLAEHDPDVLLLAHLVPSGSSHADFLRAARRIGIRSAFPVRGWDNLTNKGLLRDVPDLVLVWNDLQAAEAEELHGVPRERIRVTGAPSCDHWFEWEPSRSREEFCREVGLRSDRPFVLYACSTRFIAPNEFDFVHRWIDALRAHGGLLTDAGVLVRPHPHNAAPWADGGLHGAQVSVWPRFGESPSDEVSRRNYFDSIYHAGAVVGINTTAQIEGAIVGRQVHTLLAKEFHETQQGTLHFHYLMDEEFGHLHVARTFDEHAAQLEASLRGESDDGRNERFLRRFVRPVGLDASATGLVVEAIEELGSRPAPSPDRGPVLAPLVRLALRPSVARAARRRASKAVTARPTRELYRSVRKLAGNRAGVAVVAGPWLGDEIGELLYWIPFLRWAQTAHSGLRGRLFVACRAASAPWYAGIGSRQVILEELVPPQRLATLAGGLDEGNLQGPLREDVARLLDLGSRAFRVLPPGPLAAARVELARQDPGERVERRLLEFAPLAAAELPAELELPDHFFAVRFAFDAVYPDSKENSEFALQSLAALTEAGPVVVLDPPDPLRPELEAFAEAGGVYLLEPVGAELETAVLARARGFLGSYGASAYVAALLGVSAVGLYSGREEIADEDLQVAASFLARPPFGLLHAVQAGDGPAEAAAHAASLLEEAASAPGPRVYEPVTLAD
jgi:hypothetical protein